MSQLILYFQPDCHLCDEAEQLIQAAGLDERCVRVDIETDLELLKRYGIHVPVIKYGDDGRELFWPFELEDLAAFVQTMELP